MIILKANRYKTLFRTAISLIFICIVFIETIHAQKPALPESMKHKTDSLINRFKNTTNDTTKINLLINLGDVYKFILPDTALYYYDIALTFANISNKTKHIAQCLKNIGIVYYLKGSYNKSLDYISKSQLIFKNLGSKKGVAECYTTIGHVYLDQGFYNKSIENYLSSLKIYESIKDQKGEAGCNLNIGFVYSSQNKYSKAIEYFTKALKIYKQLENKKGILSCYNGIGNVFYKTNAFYEAIEYFLQTLNFCNETSDIKGQAACYNNIGNSYSSLGSYNKAITYLQKSLYIREKCGYKNEIACSYGNIAEIYIKIKDYSKAIENANISLNISKNIKSLPIQKQAYYVLTTAYDSLHDYKKAYEYFQLFKLINDSIFNKESSDQITEMQTKYETEKKDKDILLLNKDKALQKTELLKNEETIKRKNTLLFFIIGGFVFIVIAVVIILNQRRSNEKIKLKKKLSDLEHKALQLQMNPHFIFNSLNSISNYIAKNETDTARLYLSMFAKLMRQVLENSRESEVTLQSEINTLKYYLDLEKMQSDNKFEFDINIDENINADTITIPPMLIQPFVENSVIHGIKPKKEKGKIILRFKLEDAHLLCEIEDDGVGRPDKTLEKNGDSHKSFATQITRERLKIINKNDEFSINYYDLKDLSTNKTGTLVRFKLLYKTEV
ncbi:MAG: tetratricopeptide repeat protein [Bacteroidetes bacterium]|nr:tetratricopeptide repeat protein [Bacteroidota bacterium]